MEDLSIYRPTNLLHTQENISKYRPGGFHPVCLGDTFQDGRYKIHHKLGWGGFSTVWLAKDKMRMQWVSIKIMTADSTKDSQELKTLRSLAKYSQGDLCAKYVVQLLDDFLHQGPNGCHQCLVFELLGPTIDMVVSDYHTVGDTFEKEIILRLSEQLLQAATFLHEAGYVHGDISGRNLAFTCNRLSRMTEEHLFEVLGSPESIELVRLDGKPISINLPSHLVKAVSWVDWIDEDDEDLRIIDFGEAFLQGEDTKKLAQPGSLQAPETIFTDNFDYRLDLWRIGIVIYSFIFGTIPFHQYLGDMDILIAQMIHFVEELPTEWQQRWDQITQKSELPKEYLIAKNQPSPSRLEQKFDEMVQEESLKHIFPVIQGSMRFRPSDRISTSQALKIVRSIICEMEMIEEIDDSMDDGDLDRMETAAKARLDGGSANV